jgi:hypothetical protein
MDDLPHDGESRLRYAIACREAARLGETTRFDHRRGRNFAERASNQAKLIER